MAYYVYLLASGKYGTLYLGVTNDIIRLIYEHKSKAVAGFTRRYSIDKLVWFEIYDDVLTAIAREKELKKWREIGKSGQSRKVIRSGMICIQELPPRILDKWIPGSPFGRPGTTKDRLRSLSLASASER